VRHLELTLLRGNILAKIVKGCPDLRCLTTHYVSGYEWYSPELLAALVLLPALTELRFMKYAYASAHTMLEPLLSSHRDKLRSLKVSGYGSLGREGFASLTRDASRLWSCLGETVNHFLIHCVEIVQVEYQLHGIWPTSCDRG